MVVRVLLAVFGVCVLVAAGCTSSPSPKLPANGKILFLRQHDYVAQIYTMSPDGSEQTRLTNDGYNHGPAAWSPDGKQILFSRSEYEPFGRFRPGDYTSGPYDAEGQGLFVMNADGTNKRRLIEDRFASGAAWSPDGTLIATERGGQIHVMNSDGADRRLIVNDALWDGTIAWSPDSSRIAFMREQRYVQDIYAVNVDGSGVERLTNAPREYVEIDPRYLAWSPDGTQIAFLAGKDYDNDVYVVRADASEQWRVTHQPDTRLFLTWSPDSRHIAYAEGSGLMLMEPRGEQAVDITGPEVGRPSWYTWAPDGSTILLEARTKLYMVEVDQGEPRLLPYTRHDAWIQDWQPLP